VNFDVASARIPDFYNQRAAEFGYVLKSFLIDHYDHQAKKLLVVKLSAILAGEILAQFIVSTSAMSIHICRILAASKHNMLNNWHYYMALIESQSSQI
jgi:hypothetical protein